MINKGLDNGRKKGNKLLAIAGNKQIKILNYLHDKGEIYFDISLCKWRRGDIYCTYAKNLITKDDYKPVEFYGVQENN